MDFGLFSTLVLLAVIAVGVAAAYGGFVVLRRMNSPGRFVGIVPLLAGLLLAGGASYLLIGGLVVGKVMLWN